MYLNDLYECQNHYCVEKLNKTIKGICYYLKAFNYQSSVIILAYDYLY